MNPEKRYMMLIRRKMTRMIGLYETHCGFEGSVQKAVYARMEVERLIEDALSDAFQRGVAVYAKEAGCVV